MASDTVQKFSDANFDEQVLNSDQPVLVDFWAEWCSPCHMVAPTIDQLANEYSGKVKVGKVDTDSNHDVSIKFGITSIPTIILFNQGQIVKKFVGVTSKQAFVDELDKL